MKIEFYGGPLDGELLEIPEGAQEYKIPIPQPMEFISDTSSIPEAHSYLCHVYRIARYVKDPAKPVYHAMKYVGEQ